MLYICPERIFKFIIETMNVLITGAGRGIGYQAALALSAERGTKVLAVSRSEANLNKLKEQALDKNGAKIIPVLFDLETGNLDELAARVERECGTLDVLINNAAGIVVKPFAELAEEDFVKIYWLNVIRVASLTRKMLPLMKRKGPEKSHVLNISSMGGFQGAAKFAGLSAYSSSKAALCGLTECMAEELKEMYIAVNCLCLGAVQTEMLQEAFPGYEAPVTPLQMGHYIAGFALKGHAFFNGKILPVSLSTP
jgi:NAD(P)-dependent dehydrogenase (short-subunit alcohol dehydrogenase family)